MAVNIPEIIEQAKNGNQSAFTILLETYWLSVYRFMLQRIGDENDTEDVTIETFAKAFDKIHTYDSQFAFNTWLISIAKNVHIDKVRKIRTEFDYALDVTDDRTAYRIADTTPTAEDQLILDQNLSEILKHIEKLKPDYQEIIQLRYFQELSYNEISNQLNLPLSNVKIKLMRAKKLLKGFL